MAHFLGAVSRAGFYFTLLFLTLSVLVLGGEYSVTGAVVGTFLMTLVAEVARFIGDGPVLLGWHVPATSSSVGCWFRAPSVIVVMVWKPPDWWVIGGWAGLFGRRVTAASPRPQLRCASCGLQSRRPCPPANTPSRARTRRFCGDCGLQALRRPRCVQGRLAREARPRRDRRPYRPERRRQDHAAQHHLRHVPTQCRYRHSRRYASGRIALARRCPPWDRSHVPDDKAVPRAHGAAETSRSRPPWRFVDRPKTASLLEGFAEFGFEEMANRKGGRAPLWGAARGRDRQRRCRPVSGNVLLLDEPEAGLNDEESMELVDVVRGIRDRVGCGVLLIDHDLRLRHGAAAERMYVLDAGRYASRRRHTSRDDSADPLSDRGIPRYTGIGRLGLGRERRGARAAAPSAARPGDRTAGCVNVPCSDL